MRVDRTLFSALTIGLLAASAPALADSVSVTTGADGTTIVNGKPCRVVDLHDGGSNTTTIQTGRDGVSGSTTITRGDGGNSSSVTAGSGSSSVTVGSGSSSDGTQSSSAAGSECVIYRHVK